MMPMSVVEVRDTVEVLVGETVDSGAVDDSGVAVAVDECSTERMEDR